VFFNSWLNYKSYMKVAIFLITEVNFSKVKLKTFFWSEYKINQNCQVRNINMQEISIMSKNTYKNKFINCLSHNNNTKVFGIKMREKLVPFFMLCLATFAFAKQGKFKPLFFHSMEPGGSSGLCAGFPSRQQGSTPTRASSLQLIHIIMTTWVSMP